MLGNICNPLRSLRYHITRIIKMNKLSHDFIRVALKKADGENSKLTDFERNYLFGLSSIKLRCLLNNLCAKGNINYLELGAYRGATLISAMFENKDVTAVAVENFKYDPREPKKLAPDVIELNDDGSEKSRTPSIWDNMKSGLEDVINKYTTRKEVNGDNLTIIQADFQDVDWSEQPKFDLVFFDIDRVTEEGI